MKELFELQLSGSDAERLYRRHRPEVLALPWGRALGVRVTEAERNAARQQWTVSALQEYKSASTQAVVLAALVAARVPLDLSAIAARFPSDELAHAEICARVAGELGGGAPVWFDAARMFDAPRATTRSAVAHAAILVAQHFGVGEGWSLGFLEQLRKAARAPLLRAVWRALLRDEVVHARFAWTLLAWARGALDASQWREVEAHARASAKQLADAWPAVSALPPEAFSAISPLGAGGPSQYAIRAQRAFEMRVVRPFAALGIDLA